VEKDKDKVDELLRLGEPVIVDDAKEWDALADANVASAKKVVIASNNLETALIVTKRVRDINKGCTIITRCFQDEFVEVIETLGADEVISSSKNAFNELVKTLC
jgi:CPA2 family monovalent cation:H+ antiporter-2